MPTYVKPYPSQDELRAAFSYDAEAGHLFWIKREGEGFNPANVGRRAGRKISDGYIKAQYLGSEYRVHRMIWIWHFGELLADMQIDHINGIRDDNRIENLRCVSGCINSKNMALTRPTKSGVTGVYYDKRVNRWGTRVQSDGKVSYLGHWSSIEDAAARVAEFRQAHGFSPRHGLNHPQRRRAGQSES